MRTVIPRRALAGVIIMESGLKHKKFMSLGELTLTLSQLISIFRQCNSELDSVNLVADNLIPTVTIDLLIPRPTDHPLSLHNDEQWTLPGSYMVPHPTLVLSPHLADLEPSLLFTKYANSAESTAFNESSLMCSFENNSI